MPQFEKPTIDVAGTATVFTAETLTPQETNLRAVAPGPMNSLQTAKVGFGAPTPQRPNSYILSRVYKTPVLDTEGKVIGVLRTDIKSTVITAATAEQRVKHADLVAGMESSSLLKDQMKDLESFY